MNSRITTLTTLLLASATALPQGGIIGGLGGDDKPDRNDHGKRPPSSHGGIGISRPAKPPGTPTKPGGKKTATPDHLEVMLEGRKKYFEKRLKDIESGKEKPEKFRRVSDAEKTVKFLEGKVAEMKKQLDLADKEAAAEMRNSDDASNKKWADTAKHAEAGTVPDGMSGPQWARKLDEYEKAKAAQDVKRAGLAYRLKRKREKELQALEALVDKARGTLKRIKQVGRDGNAAIRRLRKKLLERQAYEAEAAIIRKQLEELKQLQAEAKGGKSSRADHLMKDVYATSPYWFVNKLALVSREISLQSATKPLTKKQQGLDIGGVNKPGGADGSTADDNADAEGLPLPDWMKKKPDKPGFDEKDWKKAKLKSLTRALEDANRRLHTLEKDIAAGDAVQLREMRRKLEAEHRAKGEFEYETNRGMRAMLIARKKRELEATRAQRTKDSRNKMEDHISFLKDKIAKESS